MEKYTKKQNNNKIKTGQNLVWLRLEEEPTNKPFNTVHKRTTLKDLPGHFFLIKKLNLHTKNTFF